MARFSHSPTTLKAHWSQLLPCTSLPKTHARSGPRDEIQSPSAPNSVTGLWRACTRLKTQAVTNCGFSLTQILEGVKTKSFFDSFSKFFRLVRRPGLEPMSLS
jgi:hypothetical protein